MQNNKQFMMKYKEHVERGKKGVFSVIFGRSGVLLLLILLQIGVLIVGVQFIRQYILAAYEACVFLGFILVIAIINRPGNPAFKIAWIVPILMVPVFGALFYLYFNLQIQEKVLNREYLKEVDVTEKLVHQKKEVLDKLREESPEAANMAGYLRKVSGSAVHENTSVKYYPSGEDAFDTIIEEIRNAKHYIFLEFFIINQGYMWDSVLEILKVKVSEGVEVRVLYDGMSDYFSLPKNYAKEIEKSGVQCQVFSPVVPMLSTVQNNRDHRKILVVDGNVAFTGGINLADEYINMKERFGYWKDCCIRLKGDAVGDFTLMFLQMWNVVVQTKRMSRTQLKNRVPDRESYSPYLNQPTEKLAKEQLGYVIAYDDNPLDQELTGECVYAGILYCAKKYVHITTPYLVLDHEMIMALTFAAKRGVDVKIIMPSVPDKKFVFWLARTYYEELIEAGVQIYEFQRGFIHSKMFLSDDEKAVVGSINLDFRSLYLSFECAAYIYKNSEILEMEKDYQRILKDCVKVTREACQKRSMKEKICGEVLRLFAPLI